MSYLSIVIPIYNFGDLISECLHSILGQKTKQDFEIIVYDGASTDNTQLIMEDFCKKNSKIRYIRASKKGGIDRDMARGIDFATSDYCWLFSGDDVMRSGALQQVLGRLESYSPDMLLCRHNECTYDMDVIKAWPVLKLKEDAVFHMERKEDKFRYLNKALSSEAFFSFMGGLVVKRETWLSGELYKDFIGTHWAHTGRLFKILISQPFTIFYLHEVMLDRRGGNDSFSKEGMLARLKIQIDGLLGVVGSVCGKESFEYSSLKRVLKNEIFPNWAQAVADDLKEIGDKNQIAEFEQLISRIKD